MKDPISFKKAKRLFSKKERNDNKLTLVEGVKIIREITSSALPQTIFIDNKRELNFKSYLDKIKNRVPIITLEDNELRELSDTKTNQGMIGIFAFEPPKNISEPEDDEIFLFYQVQDPINLGIILRSMIWFNMRTAYIFESVDPFNPKVIRTSSGASFKVEIKDISDIDTFMKKTSQYEKVAFTQDGETPLKEFKRPQKAIYIFGNEGSGIPDTLLLSADKKIFIEGSSKINSLNLQTSFSIFAYKLFTEI